MKTKSVITIGFLLAASLGSQAATVSLFTGGDVGEGINFSGNIIYTVNLGAGNNNGTEEDRTVSGITFKDDFNSVQLISGVNVQHNAIAGFGTAPNYGVTTNDTNLAFVMSSIAHGDNAPIVTFSNLVAGQQYRLQVLAADYAPDYTGDANTRWNSYELYSGTSAIEANLQDFSYNNNLQALHGTSKNQGVVITLHGTADSNGNLYFRTPTATSPTGDTNGIASGLILTAVPEPTTALLGGLGLLALLRRRR